MKSMRSQMGEQHDFVHVTMLHGSSELIIRANWLDLGQYWVAQHID